jgi:Na+/H+ antiporter NhaD/arsenite permease-like protein
MAPNPWITLAIVTLTFIGIAVGRYPIIKSNRTTIALMGVALLLRPVVANMENARLGWLVVASASTLAGNLTLLGSVANLIVAETANRWRIDLSFWEYTKSGFIITIFTLLIAVGWLYVRFFL